MYWGPTPSPSNSFVNLQFPVIYLSVLAIPKVVSVFLVQTLLIQRNGRNQTGAGQFMEWEHGGNRDEGGIQSLREEMDVKRWRNPSLIMSEEKKSRMGMGKSEWNRRTEHPKAFSLLEAIIITFIDL